MGQNPSTTIAGTMGTGQRSFNIAYDVPHTEDVGLSHQIPVQCWASVIAHCRINAGRLQRWPNTNPSLDLLYTLLKHVSFTQCWFNVDPQSSTPEIETASGDCTEFSDCCMPVIMWVTLSIPDFQHQITR